MRDQHTGTQAPKVSRPLMRGQQIRPGQHIRPTDQAQQLPDTPPTHGALPCSGPPTTANPKSRCRRRLSIRQAWRPTRRPAALLVVGGQHPAREIQSKPAADAMRVRPAAEISEGLLHHRLIATTAPTPDTCRSGLDFCFSHTHSALVRSTVMAKEIGYERSCSWGYALRWSRVERRLCFA
jgi:hypothetical protein